MSDLDSVPVLLISLSDMIEAGLRARFEEPPESTGEAGPDGALSVSAVLVSILLLAPVNGADTSDSVVDAVSVTDGVFKGANGLRSSSVGDVFCLMVD